jgi:hypothetical protein
MLCGASAVEENVMKMLGRGMYIHKIILCGEAEVKSG